MTFFRSVMRNSRSMEARREGWDTGYAEGFRDGKKDLLKKLETLGTAQAILEELKEEKEDEDDYYNYE